MEIQPPVEFFVTTAADGMYVQRWSPPSGAPTHSKSLVMIHGGGHSGVLWTTSPQGTPGWAAYFVECGWTVYVVDWPGVGRSGYGPEYLTISAARIAASIVALLERIGPAYLMGHSIGALLSFLTAGQKPQSTLGVVALASGPIENTRAYMNATPYAPLDRPLFLERAAVRQRFANAPAFPSEVFEEYFASLVPLMPSIRNAAQGHTTEFRIDDVSWTQKVPVLFITAEHDATTNAEPSAEHLGVRCVRLGRDWGLPDHGHLFPIERDNLMIAERIASWLDDQSVPADASIRV